MGRWRLRHFFWPRTLGANRLDQMQKNIHLRFKAFIFWTGLVICTPTNAQESFVQVNAGYGVFSSINLGLSVDVEKKYSSHDYFTFSIGYSYNDLKSHGATYNGVTYPLKIEASHFSLAANLYPIKLKKQPFSIFYIKLGLSYHQVLYNKENFHNYGPGLNYGAGVQYLILKKFVVGARYESNYYYSFGDWFKDYGNGFHFLNLSIGYRFHLKNKD